MSLVMSDRETALRDVAICDIFHARSPNGASLICLTTSITENTIFARRITSQEDLEFDRRSGMERATVQSRIDCVAPFPLDIHQTFLELDRKTSFFEDMARRGIEPEPAAYKLTEAQKRGLLFIDQHLSANAI